MDRSKFEYRLHNSQGSYYGMTTDIYMLPVGTKFSVINGAWYGEIVEQDGIKYMSIEEAERLVKLDETIDYGLVIDIKGEDGYYG